MRLEMPLGRLFAEVFCLTLLIVMLTVTPFIKPVKGEPRTWIVNDDGPADFSTIEEALNASSPGDTIYVMMGTYYETLGTQFDPLNKDHVLITGEDAEGTIIDAGGLMGIAYCGYNLTLRSLTFRNGEYGILLQQTNGGPQEVKIENCLIMNNSVGIGIACDAPHDDDDFPWGGMTREEYEDFFGPIGNIVIYHCSFVNNTSNAADNHPDTHDWHHHVLLEGNHWDDYPGADDGSGGRVADDGIGDTNIPWPAPDFDNYPLMEPWIQPDIKVTSIVPHRTIVSPGAPLVLTTVARFDVFVKNEGSLMESFNVTAYGNYTFLYPKTTYLVLSGNSSAMLMFQWLTIGWPEFEKVNVNAYATPADEEANTTNNSNKCTIVIAHMGDVNADFKVDITDVAKVSAAFGSLRTNDPQDPRYNQWWHESTCPTCPHTANADINGDDKTDITDLAKTSSNFGWHRN